MSFDQLGLRGIWLPLITPFRDDTLDVMSLTRMLHHYLAAPIDGLILCATTGEGLALTPDEVQQLVETAIKVRTELKRKIPVYLGVAGSWTRQVIAQLETTASWPIDGYLISSPSYNRPSQDGLYQHFSTLADVSAHPILIYNIPYRTGVNVENETMLRLAERENIVGVKDCCKNMPQSLDLVRRKPEEFAILTGEDDQFFTAISHGAAGGIHASAHVLTDRFAMIRKKLLSGDQPGALEDWQGLAAIPRLLFSAPSPAPLKHWLWREGLIESPELRLPMVPVGNDLATQIEQEIARWSA